MQRPCDYEPLSAHFRKRHSFKDTLLTDYPPHEEQVIVFLCAEFIVLDIHCIMHVIAVSASNRFFGSMAYINGEFDRVVDRQMKGVNERNASSGMAHGRVKSVVMNDVDVRRQILHDIGADVGISRERVWDHGSRDLASVRREQNHFMISASQSFGQ
ncbi:hypothetical protein D3C72_1828000 [compost metagenome]